MTLARRAVIAALTALVAMSLMGTGGSEQTDTVTLARAFCQATRALVTRTHELEHRLADPTPDGIDRVQLRSGLGDALSRTGNAADKAAHFLQRLDTPTTRALERRRTEVIRSLRASARSYRRMARAVNRFPTQDRDDWNAAVLVIRVRPNLDFGTAALRDFRRAALSGPDGALFGWAVRREPTCAGLFG